MRIAVISYHSSPLEEPGSGDAGGMTVYVRDLATALERRGVATDIFSRATAPGQGVVQLSDSVRAVFVPAGPLEPLSKDLLPAHVDSFVAGVEAFASFHRTPYDVIHSHYWQSGLAGRRLRESWGVPHVHSNHTLGKVKNGSLAPGDAAEPLSRTDGESLVVASADVLVASTDDELEQLAGLYGASRDRLKVLHPGVDHGLFRPLDAKASRAALGLGGEAVVLFVGRIQRLKGVELAIRAVEQVRHGLEEPMTFLVVGGASGPDGKREVARLTELVDELGLGDVVSFTGPRPHSELPLYYSAADAVVVCSYSESFGFAALEAHACGTSVIGTPVGGLAHVVTESGSGFLLDSRDPSEFAARLKTVLADEDLRARFETMAVRNATRFTWERTADEFLTLYECLIREESPEVCTCSG